jgi:hypothetical protein
VRLIGKWLKAGVIENGIWSQALRGRRKGHRLRRCSTRLIEFGRYAARRRQARGLGRPETFAFLGFTHACAENNNGRFMLKRVTIAKRMQAKLREVKESCEDGGICRSPSRVSGLQAWCEGTSPTTPCPATPMRSQRSEPWQSGTGTGRFGAAASARA